MSSWSRGSDALTYRDRSSARTSTLPGFDCVEGLLRDRLWAGLRRVDLGSHVRVYVARMDPDHMRALLMQLDANAVGERPLCRLRGSAGGLGRVVVETGDRQHVHDRAAPVGREHRSEGTAHAQRAEVVGLHL